jgi:hypothetical protein
VIGGSIDWLPNSLVNFISYYNQLEQHDRTSGLQPDNKHLVDAHNCHTITFLFRFTEREKGRKGDKSPNVRTC